VGRAHDNQAIDDLNRSRSRILASRIDKVESRQEEGIHRKGDVVVKQTIAGEEEQFVACESDVDKAAWLEDFGVVAEFLATELLRDNLRTDGVRHVEHSQVASTSRDNLLAPIDRSDDMRAARDGVEHLFAHG